MASRRGPRPWPRPPLPGQLARLVKQLLASCFRIYLRWVYFRDDIPGVASAISRMRTDQAAALRMFGATVARDCHIVGPIIVYNASGSFANLSIGSRVFIGPGVSLDLADRVDIAADVSIGTNTMIVTHRDMGRGPLGARWPRAAGPVVIRSGAFIGVGVTILHQVTIGEEAIIGAGAFVSADVPARHLFDRTGAVVPDRRAPVSE